MEQLQQEAVFALSRTENKGFISVEHHAPEIFLWQSLAFYT